MGMQARVFVIGPLSVLRKHDVLCYPDDYYEDAPEDAVVLGCAAQANSNMGSRILATMCDTRPFDLWNHRVTACCLPTDFIDNRIGDQFVEDVYNKIWGLLAEEDIQVWYEPNG